MHPACRQACRLSQVVAHAKVGAHLAASAGLPAAVARLTLTRATLDAVARRVGQEAAYLEAAAGQVAHPAGQDRSPKAEACGREGELVT